MLFVNQVTPSSPPTRTHFSKEHVLIPKACRAATLIGVLLAFYFPVRVLATFTTNLVDGNMLSLRTVLFPGQDLILLRECCPVQMQKLYTRIKSLLRVKASNYCDTNHPSIIPQDSREENRNVPGFRCQCFEGDYEEAW